MKKSRIMALVIASTMVIGALVGCGKKEEATVEKAAEKKEQKDIKIAVVGPMTGDNAQYGQAFQKATELMAKKINSSGGINGSKINLEFMDDKNDPTEATNVAQRLADDPDVIGVIGHFSSAACIAAAPVYMKANLVEFSPSSSSAQFTKQGNYMFRNINTQDTEGPLNAKFLVKELGKKNVAVIYQNNEWGITAKDGFEKEVKNLGGNITIEEPFTAGQTKDFTQILEKVKSTNPDVVYLAAMYAEAGLITQQAKQTNYNAQMAGSCALYNEQFIKLGGSSVEGFYLGTNFYPGDPSAAVKGFVEDFKNAYGAEPNQFAALAYDCLGMMAEALKKSGPDRAKLRDELAKIKDYSGATGVTSFNENRDVIKKMLILQVKDGKFNISPTQNK